MVNASLKKQTILNSSCAPPLCRRGSERWGRNVLIEGDAALMVAENQSRRNFPFPADLRLLQGRMTLSRVSYPSDIIYSLWSDDIWRLVKRNYSQFHSCVEHKTKRKQVNRIWKKTRLTWWQIQRYTDLSKGNQKRSWKENWAADSHRGNLQFWVLRGCVVHSSWKVWRCT